MQSPHNSYFTELTNYDSLALIGPDNSKFLQGQISCNLDKLSTEHSLRGAYCTPKGNVIANFDLCLYNDTIYLHLAKGMAAQVQAAMAKYIVFSKAELKDQSQTWVRFGIWGAESTHLAQQVATQYGLNKAATITKQLGACASLSNGFIYCASDRQGRYVIYCQPEQAAAMQAILQAHSQPTDLSAWEVQQIKDGVVYTGEATTDSYVPQMLNLQEVHAIDFKKGCYTGQEIVARMQYLGKLKRHLMIGTIQVDPIKTGQVPEVGMHLNSGQRNNIGRITSLAPIDTQTYWFSGVINIKEADDTHLHVSGIDNSHITLQPLPYEIDEQVFERIKL